MTIAQINPLLSRSALVAALFLAPRLLADTVVTANGARIVGKITGIHAGVISMETDYAGKLEVKQALVTSIETDRPVAVRLADGSRVVGIMSSPGPRAVHISSPTRTVDSTVAEVAGFWAAGQEDPEVVALRRKWSYEAGADVNGRKGTQSQLATSYHFRAKLAGPADTFEYYTAYTRQETNGQVSADQFKAGVDYTDNYSPKENWYVRDEAGFDRVNFITLYDLAAGGLGHDFIKTKDEVFTSRVGLSYRYDQYAAGKGPALSSAGADFGLAYSKKFKSSQLSDKISFDPAFQDLGNYVFNHEFDFEIPVYKSLWKIGIGVSNTYYSRPVGGVDKLDTLFFSRLILTWGAQPSS